MQFWNNNRIRELAFKPAQLRRLAEIPIIVIKGLSDEVTPPSHVCRLFGKFHQINPNAELIEVGTGHITPMENPAVVRNAVRGFIK